MDQYLQTTDSASLPNEKLRHDTPGYNGQRVTALMNVSELSRRPIFALAVTTMKNRSFDHPGGDILASMVPPEMAAMLNLQNQICSGCRIKDAPLFTCKCCGILQTCSKECLRQIEEKLSDHRQTTCRF